ncbi:MAG: Gfo/Idh/MocA family protein [Nitrososphaeraceae archaeon]
MKFLICGLGSIGQRHTRIIRKLLGNEVEIAAYRARKLDIVISESLEASFDKSPEKEYGLRCFYDLQSAIDWQPDAVFITNPVSMHITTAIEVAKHGCHLFIEKPLSHELNGIDELCKLVEGKNLVCMVGYQMRYHPALISIKHLCEQKNIGRLVSADIHFGEWLPGMHPYEDYRTGHASRSDQGGGVILCLSHEIDYACWLFGKPVKVYAIGGHLSNLEIDVEDTADIILSCRDTGRIFPVHVHLDFLQKPARRYCHIVGEKGSILWDYFGNYLEVRNLQDGTTKKTIYDRFQRNDMFAGEVEDFINSIKNSVKPPISLADGLECLNVCLAAKRSIVSGKEEWL